MLTPIQIIITILAVALGTMLTRFTPFFLFPEHKEIPSVVEYLGKVLPPAMIGLLVVYCLKNVAITKYPNGIPELIAILLIVVLHLWKRNALVSIAGGTILYMYLVQMVFV